MYISRTLSFASGTLRLSKSTALSGGDTDENSQIA